MHLHMLSNHSTIQFMRFKHTHLKMCLVYKSHLHTSSSLFHFVYTIHIQNGFRSVNPVLFIIRQCAYTFHNFGLPSCQMPIGAPRHVVFKCHTPSRWMLIGASCQVEHFFNVIHHHDGCRLVHPANWDIGQFRVAFMTDSVGESRHVGRSVYRFNSRCQELTNSFTIQLFTRMQLIVHISNITFSNPYALS